jgi:hypothetical protein
MPLGVNLILLNLPFVKIGNFLILNLIHPYSSDN